MMRDLRAGGLSVWMRKLSTLGGMCLHAVLFFRSRVVDCYQHGGVEGCLRTGLCLLSRVVVGCGRVLIDLIVIMLAVVLHGVRRLVCVRVGALRSDRIGHFCANTEVWLCEKEAGLHGPRVVDLFYYDRPICNQVLKTMWDRTLRVSPLYQKLDDAFAVLKWESFHHIDFFNAVAGARDPHGLLASTTPHLSFTPEEELAGRLWLQANGVCDGSSFVCLNVRDSAYLDQAIPTHGKWSWDYHAYRDSDILTYVLAAESLAERGYHVFRMGAVVEKRLLTSHPRIHDYASNGQRSEFLDIYLSAKCRFFVSTGTGLDSVATIFRRPICWVNYIPLGLIPTWDLRTIVILKTLFSRQLNRTLHFDEVVDLGLAQCSDAGLYRDAGVEVVPNTPEEIRDAVLEMVARLDGIWVASPDDDDLQSRFWGLIRPCELHRVFQARVGAQFLRTYRYLLPRQDCCGGGGCA